jgi:hypothetical protein
MLYNNNNNHNNNNNNIIILFRQDHIRYGNFWSTSKLRQHPNRSKQQLGHALPANIASFAGKLRSQPKQCSLFMVTTVLGIS